jgi:hypothetical protein
VSSKIKIEDSLGVSKIKQLTDSIYILAQQATIWS